MAIETTTPATEPDNTPTDQTGADTTTAATGAADGGEGGAPEGQQALPVDIDLAAVEAFDAGLATTAPKDAADVAAAAQAAAGKDKPPAAAPAPAPAAAAPAVAPAAAAPAKTDPDPEIVAEAKALGLKGKASERFHEMAGTIKDFAPMRETMTKLGLKDPAQVEQIFETAARSIEWENTVLASTATPQQFGTALNAIKALNSGDPQAMNVAYDAMLGAAQELAKKLGREIPGLFDPLDAHPDLKQEVEDQDITRKRALEIAAQRATAERNNEVNANRDALTEHQAAIDRATVDVTSLNAELKSVDADFARKLPYLQPSINAICQSMHPSKWAAEIRKAYHALPALPPAAAAPAPAPAPAAPRVGHMPLRPTGGNGAMKPKPRTDEEAFSMGVDSVTPQ